MAPAVLVQQGLRDQPVDVGAIGLGSAVLFLLVVLRMAGLVAQVQDQATQLAALAHNDALTGIPNRRAWELELPREMARVRRQGGRLHAATAPWPLPPRRVATRHAGHQPDRAGGGP